MKKTFVLSAVAALLLSAVSVVVYVNNDKNQMDDIFRANVEVLTKDESDDKSRCYREFRTDPCEKDNISMHRIDCDLYFYNLFLLYHLF